MKPKSDKQLAIEFRDKIAARIIENKANLLWWKIIIRQSKTNSPEIVDALSKKNATKELIEKDILFLKCIDDLISSL